MGTILIRRGLGSYISYKFVLTFIFYSKIQSVHLVIDYSVCVRKGLNCT
jgi:hypothetical protein